jgi:replicative superfamily II helicase
VLADGTGRWGPLVESFLDRTPPVWDFFPSQVEAITAGLLTSSQTYSLQMPTGAGKTALTETLLFGHLTSHPSEAAVLLVPYRALARELKNSVGRRMSAIGLPTRSIYGGTVPTQEDSQDLESIRAFIATPEALTGLLSRAPGLLSRISLVICDEGHLLDGGARGIGLELLLARLRGRSESRPRVVFVSAIVPNIEEVNTWLGGSDATVVKSDFRPAEAEYAVLRPVGNGRNMHVGLEAHPVSTTLQAHTLPDFLQVSDFEFTNPATGRRKTYTYSSIKTQAIAAARKSLTLGTVAVFAATKTGDQGVVGLATELIQQVESGLPLPHPATYITDTELVATITDYVEREYGADWIGTKALRIGTIIHHGDIPQETREALEELLNQRGARMVLCTSTLAEGVNLPIRTLVLYAVRRRSASGQPIPMLSRDIRNLVGRAGRAGSSTRGLVICANPNQWDDILPVATGQPGEIVQGALHELLGRLHNAMQRNGLRLTNTRNSQDLWMRFFRRLSPRLFGRRVVRQVSPCGTWLLLSRVVPGGVR